MRRRDLLSGLSLVPLAVPAVAQCVVPTFPATNTPGTCFDPGIAPSLDLSFLTGVLDPSFTFSRASIATDGRYTDATGSSYTTFQSGAPRMLANGLLIEQASTNLLLNSDAPATQTTASLATGTYVLWVIGSGTATAAAGTATGSGFGAASAGTPRVFTISVAGTVSVTVTGSLTRFQLEANTFPTTYIPTAGATITRARDAATAPIAVAAGSVLSLSADFMLPGLSATANQFAVTIDDGANTNRVALYRVGSTTELRSTNAAAGQIVAGTLVTAGTVAKLAVRWSAVMYTAAAQGQTPVAGGSTAVPAMTTLRLGDSQPGTGTLNGWLQRVRFWRRLLSPTEMQEITAP